MLLLRRRRDQRDLDALLARCEATIPGLRPICPGCEGLIHTNDARALRRDVLGRFFHRRCL